MLNHPFTRRFEAGELDVEDERWWTNDHRPETHLKSLHDTLQFELDHGQLSNFQLRLVDRHSMAHSLEVALHFWVVLTARCDATSNGSTIAFDWT